MNKLIGCIVIIIFLLISPIFTASAQVQTKVIDKSGNTRFHYLIVSGDENAEKPVNYPNEIKTELEKYKKKDGSTLEVLTDTAKWEDIIKMIEELKKKAEPGDEFVFIYMGHGGGGKGFGVPDKDSETKGDEEFDNHMTITRKDKKADLITDDKFSEVISGFKKSVTIVIINVSCFGGSFEADLERAKNAEKEPKTYGDHLATMGLKGVVNAIDVLQALVVAISPGDDGNPQADKKPKDKEKDGVLTAEELEDFLKSKVPKFKTESIEVLQEDFEGPPFFCISPSEDIPVGGEIIPLETTSLILAGAQSTTWMIPVVLSIVGIGLVFLRRK